MKTLAVLGATGAMGRRVVALAERGLPGVQVLRLSRRAQGAAARRADLDDASSLMAALAGVDLLVNAVGPYGYDPAPLVRACVGAGCHYADLAEDPTFLGAVEAAALDAGAGAAGCCVVPGCSTVPGLVELAARQLAGGLPVARLAAWLSLGSRNPVSPGLLYGLLRPLGRPIPGGPKAFAGSLPAHDARGRRRRFARYPAPFPVAGLEVDGRRLPLAFHVGFDRGWLVRALVLAAPAVARLSDPALQRLARVAAPFAQLARPLGTPHGLLRVEGFDAEGARVGAIEVRARRDGLDIPAAPPVWLARRWRAGAAPLPGPRRLAELVPFGEAAQWLVEAGYEVDEILA